MVFLLHCWDWWPTDLEISKYSGISRQGNLLCLMMTTTFQFQKIWKKKKPPPGWVCLCVCLIPPGVHVQPEGRVPVPRGPDGLLLRLHCGLPVRLGVCPDLPPRSHHGPHRYQSASSHKPQLMLRPGGREDGADLCEVREDVHLI